MKHPVMMGEFNLNSLMVLLSSSSILSCFFSLSRLVQLWSHDDSTTDIPAGLYDAKESKLWKEWATDSSFADSFHKAIIDTNKDISRVSSNVARPVGFCLWYYYNKYKPSYHYKVLKSHMTKLQIEQSRNRDECTICEDGGGEFDGCVFTIFYISTLTHQGMAHIMIRTTVLRHLSKCVSPKLSWN